MPKWTAALAVLLGEQSPNAIAMRLAEASSAWHETLGVPPAANEAAIRQAMGRLSLLYHPDNGGTQAQMGRINAAYAQARAFVAADRVAPRPYAVLGDDSCAVPLPAAISPSRARALDAPRGRRVETVVGTADHVSADAFT